MRSEVTTPRPEAPAEHLGELARAYRIYTGLSQRVFAFKLGINPKTVSDIEIGKHPAPVGYIDSCEDLTDQFDLDVDHAIELAEESLGGDEEHSLHVTVSERDDPEQVYWRAVAGRASMLSGKILPILEGKT